jgi:hypothetical protein
MPSRAHRAIRNAGERRSGAADQRKPRPLRLPTRPNLGTIRPFGATTRIKLGYQPCCKKVIDVTGTISRIILG